MDVLKNVLFTQYKLDKVNIPKSGMKSFQISWVQSRDKIKSLHEMKAKYPPILGKWYQHHFQNSQSFLNARHQYVKSVAIISVVGYLFGLGDRHLENILVDLRTGEIAHVDFNSMFNANEKLP
jgi:cell cycle checkpoint protein MEC1